MRVLITGVTGFAGSHLADLCVKAEDEVFGTYRWRSDRSNIQHLLDNHTLALRECDVRDFVSVHHVLEDLNPDVIFHLAAQSLVPTSWNAPFDTFDTNVKGTLNVLEAVRSLNLIDTVVLIAGSSEEYGKVDLSHGIGYSITEDFPLNPLSPYAVSKVAADLLGYQYHHSYGLKVVRTRAFNHSGARRPDNFVLSGFVHQIMAQFHTERVRMDRSPIIIVKHGDLSARRDFVHVLDVVLAYYKLALSAKYDSNFIFDPPYNICSGIAWPIDRALHVIEFQFEQMSLPKISFVHELDPKRFRPSDVPVLKGSHKYITSRIGWVPQRGLVTIIKDLIRYWFDRV